MLVPFSGRTQTSALSHKPVSPEYSPTTRAAPVARWAILRLTVCYNNRRCFIFRQGRRNESFLSAGSVVYDISGEHLTH